MLVQRCPLVLTICTIIFTVISPHSTPDNRHPWLQGGANIVTVCCTRLDCQMHSASTAKIQKVLRPESCAKAIHSGWLGLGETPQEKTRKQRKHSQPWHGPYHVLTCNDPGLTVVKVYFPQDGQIQVNQLQVTPFCKKGSSWMTRSLQLLKWSYIQSHIPELLQFLLTP